MNQKDFVLVPDYMCLTASNESETGYLREKNQRPLGPKTLSENLPVRFCLRKLKLCQI